MPNNIENILNIVHQAIQQEIATARSELRNLIRSNQVAEGVEDDSNHILVTSGNIVEKQENHNRVPLKPMIKWSGGKPDAYNLYLEPFIGGGSVYFYLNPKAAVISDVHTELVDFYSCMSNQEQANEIYEFMRSHPNDEETYYKVRKGMNRELGHEPTITSSIEKAKRFYYLRKTCFRGMMRYNKKGKFNVSFGRYKKCNYEILKDKRYTNLLSRTTILNTDFKAIFERYNDENHFMFLDPPYDCEFTDYGYCKFGKKEHEELARLFKSTIIKCLMVIGKTDFIVSLYKDYIVDEYDKKYRFKIYSNRVTDSINRKHLVIKNY